MGAHWAKDALGNFVLDPLKSSAVSQTLSMTGLQGAANSIGRSTDSMVKMAAHLRQLHAMFTQ